MDFKEALSGFMVIFWPSWSVAPVPETIAATPQAHTALGAVMCIGAVFLLGAGYLAYSLVRELPAD